MLTASPQRERECQAREMKHVSLSPSTQPKWMAQHLAISDVPIWGKNGRVEFDVINHHNLLQFPKTNMTGWNYFAVLRQSFAEPINCQYKSKDEICLIWRSRYHLSIYCVYQEFSCNDTMVLQVTNFILTFKIKKLFYKNPNEVERLFCLFYFLYQKAELLIMSSKQKEICYTHCWQQKYFVGLQMGWWDSRERQCIATHSQCLFTLAPV